MTARIFFLFITTSSLVLSDEVNKNQTFYNDDLNNETPSGGDFINKYGHLVKNYKKPTKSTSQRKKNAQEINTLVGRNFYFGGLGYAEKLQLTTLAGLSISSDENKGIQFLGSINYSNYEEYTFRSYFNNFDYLSLERSSYGIGGTLRYFSRSYLLEPVITVKNFAQVGIGYNHITSKLTSGFGENYNQGQDIGLYGDELIKEWSNRATNNFIRRESFNIYNVNVGVGSEFGFKSLTISPSINHVQSFGDLKVDEVIFSTTLSFFTEIGFLSASISKGEDSPETYGLFYGNYF